MTAARSTTRCASNIYIDEVTQMILQDLKPIPDSK